MRSDLSARYLLSRRLSGGRRIRGTQSWVARRTLTLEEIAEMLLSEREKKKVTRFTIDRNSTESNSDSVHVLYMKDRGGGSSEIFRASFLKYTIMDILACN